MTRASCASTIPSSPKLAGVPFVVDAREAERADNRRFAQPLTRVGPVRSGSLREFEETDRETER